MNRKKEHLRVAVGRALRELRRQGRLSLDDVERNTRAAGLRVTRSHLSRVETGQVDIGLPRFISLVRVLGQVPSDAIEEFESLIPSEHDAGPKDRASIRSLMDKGEFLVAARRLRRSLQLRSVHVDRRHERNRLARCEVALGRWHAAERLHRQNFRTFGPERINDTLACAVVASAVGSNGLALAVLVAAKDFDPLRTGLFRAACLIRLGHRLEAESLVSGAIRSLLEGGDLRSLALMLRAEIEMQSLRTVDASRSGAAAVDQAESPLVAVEAGLTLARCERRRKKPKLALRILGKSLRHARETSMPDLIARVHDARAQALRLLSQNREAAMARRSANNVRRRAESDRTVLDDHPWHALYAIAAKER